MSLALVRIPPALALVLIPPALVEAGATSAAANLAIALVFATASPPWLPWHARPYPPSSDRSAERQRYRKRPRVAQASKNIHPLRRPPSPPTLMCSRPHTHALALTPALTRASERARTHNIGRRGSPKEQEGEPMQRQRQRQRLTGKQTHTHTHTTHTHARALIDCCCFCYFCCGGGGSNGDNAAML